MRIYMYVALRRMLIQQHTDKLNLLIKFLYLLDLSRYNEEEVSSKFTHNSYCSPTLHILPLTGTPLTRDKPAILLIDLRRADAS
jgi:hypothetical protein